MRVFGLSCLSGVKMDGVDGQCCELMCLSAKMTFALSFSLILFLSLSAPLFADRSMSWTTIAIRRICMTGTVSAVLCSWPAFHSKSCLSGLTRNSKPPSLSVTDSAQLSHHSHTGPCWAPKSLPVCVC